MTEHTTKTSAALARAIVLAATARSLMNAGASLEKALEASCRDVTPQEKAACQALVYTATRRHMLAQTVLSMLAQRPPEAQVKAILLVSLAELYESPQKSYVICNEAVKAVKSINVRAAGFANACLRRFTRERDSLCAKALKHEEVRFNAPAWWIEKLRAALDSDKADKMMALAQKRPPMTVRVNRRKITVDDWRALAQTAGLRTVPLGHSAVMLESPVPVSELPGFAEGLVSVQDAGAQLAAQFLSPQNGQRILDACAAPGGKTAHLLELADCSVTALEVDSTRCGRIHENLVRLGLQADVRTSDAADISCWYDGNPFDSILLDAPCTASGIVRRHPDIVFSRRPSDINELAKQQKRLLEALWPLVKFGGKLLYVVCSVFEEEGQNQIKNFLSRHPEAKLAPVAEHAPLMLTLAASENDQESFPGIAPVHDGFFYALLLKH